MQEKNLGEIQQMIEMKLADVRSDLRSSEGGLFWRSDEEEMRQARIVQLQELEVELVAMLERTYED